MWLSGIVIALVVFVLIQVWVWMKRVTAWWHQRRGTIPSPQTLQATANVPTFQMTTIAQSREGLWLMPPSTKGANIVRFRSLNGGHGSWQWTNQRTGERLTPAESDSPPLYLTALFDNVHPLRLQPSATVIETPGQYWQVDYLGHLFTWVGGGIRFYLQSAGAGAEPRLVHMNDVDLASDDTVWTWQ